MQYANEVIDRACDRVAESRLDRMNNAPKTREKTLDRHHENLKALIVRLLKGRQQSGGRPSIALHLIQRQLNRQFGFTPLRGVRHGKAEEAIRKAIRALRSEKPPRIEPRRGGQRVR